VSNCQFHPTNLHDKTHYSEAYNLVLWHKYLGKNRLKGKTDAFPGGWEAPIDLLRMMLKMDPKDRVKPRMALEHVFIRREAEKLTKDMIRLEQGMCI